MIIKPSKKSIITAISLVLMVMLLIFLFSAQTGAESNAISNPIVDRLLTLFVADFGALAAAEAAALRKTFKFIVRKGAHFIIYALLGLFLYIFFALFMRKKKGENLEGKALTKLRFSAAAIAWAVGTLYACTDEYHQTFSAGRDGKIADVFLDSFGCLCGIAAIMLALYILGKLSKAQISQIIKFLLVGFAVFFVDFILLHFFWDKLGLMYLVAATVSYAIATVVSYFLNMRLVFQGKDDVSKGREFAIFVALCLVALGINALCMWLFVDGMGLHVLMAKIFAEAIVMIWHFFSRKKFLEKKN